MRFRGKRSIELALNFIVVFILSIVVFGFGLWFAYNIYDKGKNIVEPMDRPTQDQLDTLLVDHNFAVLPTYIQTYNRKTATFYMGLKNELDTASESDDFIVRIQFVKAVDKDENEISDPSIRSKITLSSSSLANNPGFVAKQLTVKKHAKGYFPILIKMNGVPKGVYIFDVTTSLIPTGTYYYEKIKVEIL